MVQRQADSKHAAQQPATGSAALVHLHPAQETHPHAAAACRPRPTPRHPSRPPARTVYAVHHQRQVCGVGKQAQRICQARLGPFQQDDVQLKVSHHFWVHHRACQAAAPGGGAHGRRAASGCAQPSHAAGHRHRPRAHARSVWGDAAAAMPTGDDWLRVAPPRRRPQHPRLDAPRQLPQYAQRHGGGQQVHCGAGRQGGRWGCRQAGKPTKTVGRPAGGQVAAAGGSLGRGRHAWRQPASSGRGQPGRAGRRTVVHPGGDSVSLAARLGAAVAGQGSSVATVAGRHPPARIALAAQASCQPPQAAQQAAPARRMGGGQWWDLGMPVDINGAAGWLLLPCLLPAPTAGLPSPPQAGPAGRAGTDLSACCRLALSALQCTGGCRRSSTARMPSCSSSAALTTCAPGQRCALGRLRCCSC